MSFTDSTDHWRCDLDCLLLWDGFELIRISNRGTLGVILFSVMGVTSAVAPTAATPEVADTVSIAVAARPAVGVLDSDVRAVREPPVPTLLPVAGEEGEELFYAANDVFPAFDDPGVDKDPWLTVRTFLMAMLAEPVLNVFIGCDALEVEVLARALMDAVPSAVWSELIPCVTPVVFVWQFLLLARNDMDASPGFCQAVGELIFFTLCAEEQTMPL